MGILYIVPTPIGNLKDITLRAMQVLFEADLIACEDTRRTGLLLQKLEEMRSYSSDTGKKSEHPPLISYYEHNELLRIPELITFLHMGKNIALVSDAGTPAISDPGFKLIREAIKENIKLEALPGASAPLVALIASGLPTDKFTFAGYPPRKPGHRKTFFENILKSQEFIKATVILFEAPHKLIKTLGEMQEIFGDIDIVICRELTKTHQEIRHEKISASLIHFKKKEPKGEIVVLFNLG